MIRSLLLGGAIVLELLVFLVWMDASGTKVEWSIIILIHLIASTIFSFASWLFLPIKYTKNKWWPKIFLLLFSFCLPIFGMIGIAASLLVALHLPIRQSEVTWQECDDLPLPPSPGEINPNSFGAGALAEILIRNEDPERRLLAVSAIHHFPRSQSVPLLQLALKDLSDDVRLLAYSSLESIEAEINLSIGECKKQLDKNRTAEKAAEIGQQYWELCYLGIAEGGLLSHYLREAKYYLKLSNQIRQSGSNNLLIGRICLKQKKYNEANDYFEKALESELLVHQVAPYLAECAFHQKDYKRVRKLVRNFPSQQGTQLSQIKEFWV